MVKAKQRSETRYPSVFNDSDDEDNGNEEPDDELLNLRADIVDESDRVPLTSTDLPYNRHPVCAEEVRSVLGSHHFVLEDILISLLCSDNSTNWSSFNSEELYGFTFSSTHAMYTSMTNHDIDIVINVL